MYVIHVYGTSHVSEDSFEVIDRALEEHDPEIVAVELDTARLNSMLTGQEDGTPNMFLWVLKKMQDFAGSKTGVIPGQEMKYAFNKSMAQGREVALIDQDIRVTMNRLKQVSRKEKIRALLSLAGGFFMSDDIDISKIPEQELIGEMIEQFGEEFPGLYRVLIDERNRVMVARLRRLDEDTEGDIVAFVGAGHEAAMKKELQS